MLTCVLESGSKGNCTLIKGQNINLLIDAGGTFKYLCDKLKELDLSIKDINYILISHTHSDHTSALQNIIKVASPTIIVSELMYKDLGFLKRYDNVMFMEESFTLDNIEIETIKTSHDTTDSRGFIITEGKSSLVQITDTGYLNQKYFRKLKNKNLYILESNHNVEMLMHGRYPKWLKARVASDEGHLSNDASSFYLTKIIGSKTKMVILAHLSEENNTPEIALATLKKELEDNNIEFTNYITAKQNERTDLIEV